MGKYLYIVLLYFLFNRSIGKNILYSDLLDGIYIISSQLFSLIIGIQFFTKIGKKIFNKNAGSILYMLLPILSLLLSTIINYESYLKWGQFTYPTISMCFFICLYCSSLSNIKLFVKAIANFHFILAFINFLFLIFSPHFFGTVSLGNSGDRYFLGIENQIGYPLLIGLFFNLIEYRFTKNRKKIILYALIHTISTFIIFSGTTVTSVVIMYFLLLPNPISWYLRKLSLGVIFISVVILFITILFFFNIETILEIPILTYLIEDGLHKNTTLTNRTLIWALVIGEFWKSPIFGYAMGETGNMFYIKGHYWSSHNTILQFLYYGGIMFYISIIPLVYRFNSLLKKLEPDITHIFKCTICAMFFAFMGEAVNIYFMLNIIFFGIVLSITLSKKSF